MKFFSNKAPINVAAVLTEQEIHDIEHYMHHYPDPRAASLDALKIVQKRNGWVNDDQVDAIAAKLGITGPDVEGVATFYNRIYRSPVGRHVILICDSIACYLMGSETLIEAFKRHLGVELGQTTADGRFTLINICCLGNCDKGPTMLIDEDLHSLVGVEDISSILERYV